ncbi:cysteine--tRNA ligase, partial [Rhizobiaceae bacterium]|nr:cysteine--tRNA ligase [Rhizobiaceae bacterium]
MTELTLYNTMTRSKEPFRPIDPKNVRMYVCGPTVYDHAHIGNARPVIVFDVLFRLLRHIYGEEHVTYVRNITDVDDKIIDRARRDFPDMDLNDAIAQVTEKTTAQFQADMKALGCLEPTVEPRATQHIDGMIEMIQTLISRGHAYVAKGEKGREVLFDVTSDDDYGILSNRKDHMAEQQAGARVAVESHKKNPGDFVLWKESAADQPGWEGLFDGETIHGRPGWHIECSAMSKAHLGDTFDIHGGGLDLIFPHHENEIAQSCCANGTQRMANVWMHNGFLQVEGKKMSKSDGNFITVDDLLHTEKFGGRKWPGEVVRLAILMTHYREPLDFTVRRLEEASNLCHQLHAFASAPLEPTTPTNKFLDLLLADLDSRGAFVDLYKRLDGIRSAPNEQYQVMRADGQILGLMSLTMDEWHNKVRSLRAVLESEIVEKRDERLAHIAAKNWPDADRIRDELLAQGI